MLYDGFFTRTLNSAQSRLPVLNLEAQIQLHTAPSTMLDNAKPIPNLSQRRLDETTASNEAISSGLNNTLCILRFRLRGAKYNPASFSPSERVSTGFGIGMQIIGPINDSILVTATLMLCVLAHRHVTNDCF